MQSNNHEIWLWNEIRYSNERALYQLYMQNYDHLFRYGLHAVHDRTLVMESINETFTEIWLKRGHLPEVDKVQGYLFIIFKRKLFRGVKQSKHPGLLENLAGYPVTQQEYSYEMLLIANQTEEDMKFRIQSALEMLTPRQKELIRLRYYDNLSLEEISGKTAISLRTIYNTLHAAIKTLRKELQGEKGKKSRYSID